METLIENPPEGLEVLKTIGVEYEFVKLKIKKENEKESACFIETKISKITYNADKSFCFEGKVVRVFNRSGEKFDLDLNSCFVASVDENGFGTIEVIEEL